MLVGALHFTCPPVVGGVERLIAQHARLLRAHGHHVRVLAGRGAPLHPEVPLLRHPALDSKHPEVLAIGEELDRGTVSDRFSTLSDTLLRFLRQATAEMDACIVHNAFTLHFNLPLTWALDRLSRERPGIRWIAWCHDLSWTNPLYVAKMRPAFPWDLLRTVSETRRYVVVSDDRRRDLSRIAAVDPRQVSVIPAGVDRWDALRVRASTRRLLEGLPVDSALPLLLLPARLTRRKNVELAIRIVRALADRGLNPLLLVTGPPGPHNPRSVDYVDELRALRRKLGVEQQVAFLYEWGVPAGRSRRVSDESMTDLYQLCDALLFPSAQEGFGIPLLEAGLARLPVFCSDIPPFCEIAADRAQFFQLNEPADEIAHRMHERLLADDVFALRRRVLETFGWPRLWRERIEPLLLGTDRVAS